MYKKSFLLAVKLTVIRCNEAGEHELDVCKVLDVTRWTLKSILKNRDKIKECGKMAAPWRAFILSNTHCPFNLNLISVLKYILCWEFSYYGSIHGRTVKFANSPLCACCGSTGKNLSMIWWHWHISISKPCCCWSVAVSFWVASITVCMCFGVPLWECRSLN